MPSQQSSRTSTTAFSQQPTLIGSTTPPPRANGSALDRAIIQFRNRLTGAELMEFKGTTHDNLRKELLKVQEKQEARLETMNLARIKHCLEAMNQFGQVIEIFLNVADAVAFVWGPMKFLLLVSMLTVERSTSIDRRSRQQVRLQTLSIHFWMRTKGSASNYLC